MSSAMPARPSSGKRRKRPKPLPHVPQTLPTFRAQVEMFRDVPFVSVLDSRRPDNPGDNSPPSPRRRRRRRAAYGYRWVVDTGRFDTDHLQTTRKMVNAVAYITRALRQHHAHTPLKSTMRLRDLKGDSKLNRLVTDLVDTGYVVAMRGDRGSSYLRLAHAHDFFAHSPKTASSDFGDAAWDVVQDEAKLWLAERFRKGRAYFAFEDDDDYFDTRALPPESVLALDGPVVAGTAGQVNPSSIKVRLSSVLKLASVMEVQDRDSGEVHGPLEWAEEAHEIVVQWHPWVTRLDIMGLKTEDSTFKRLAATLPDWN